MPTPILATKLFVPPPRVKIVPRARLTERLNQGLQGKLTLLSAPAGFGKTTLVCAWVAGIQKVPSAGSEAHPARPTAWLSLDEEDNDPIRFLTYLIAALQTLVAKVGERVLSALQSSQPPREPDGREAILTSLVNELTTIPGHIVLVLDDYHVIEAKAVDKALTFLLKHLPPQLHLVVATREDPNLPLAHLRARGQLTELRSADLRFTPDEAAEFLNRVMGLDLSAEEIAVLERRTEGWIAGLQLAALSMRGQKDVASFIQSFTGSHRFVMDYLVEEVLHQQPESVQTFLLHTSILDRLCGPLCDAVLLDPTTSGQENLETLEQANLFIVPLDNERRWYRYHYLFAELLRQRLHASTGSSTEGSLTASEQENIAELHRRASTWYEENGLEMEAFHHATAATDYARAERLIEGSGMPLHFRGAVAPVLHWLESLPTTVLDAWPSLWTAYASTLLATGQTTSVEAKLQAAEAALQGTNPDDGSDSGLDAKNRDLIGRIAAIRATLAASQQQVESIITYSRRALEYLHADNLAFRTSTTWKLGYAYDLQGNRAAASRAYTEVISIGQASGNVIFTTAATIGLGGLQAADNHLHLAAETYWRALQMYGDSPLPDAGVAYLGLARICYEWNDLDAAYQHAQQSIQLAQQIENSDRSVSGKVLLARLKLAHGDVTGAAALLARTEQFARRHKFAHCMKEVAAAQVLTLLHEENLAGNLAAAAHLAQRHELLISLARVHLVQGDTAAALTVLEPLRQQMEAKGWADKILKVKVLQALAHHAQGEEDAALQLLGEVLALAVPEGFIRTFVDEGLPMAQLLRVAAARNMMPDYTGKLLAVFEETAIDNSRSGHRSRSRLATEPSPASLVEPLSEREVEILHLIATGKKNQEIANELVISLNTVRYHTKNLYGKLSVNKRTQAVAKAQALGII